MKFYNYLTEEDVGSKTEQFKKDCAPILSQLKELNYNHDYILKSGRLLEKDLIVKKKVRKNRIPLDTPLIIHKILDEAFKKRFGVKARSESIFVINDPWTAQDYGKLYYVFPVGKNYKFIWSNKIADLFSMIVDNFSDEMKFAYLDQDDFKELGKMFEKHDELYYKSNMIHISPKEEEGYKKITKKSFIKIMNRVTKNIVKEYKQSNNIKNLKDVPDKEIMLVANNVWMIRKLGINIKDFLKEIEVI